MHNPNGKPLSLALSLFAALLVGTLVAACSEPEGDGTKVKSIKSRRSAAAKKKTSSGWQPTAQNVEVIRDQLSVQLEGCGKNCSVVSKLKPTKFEYGQSSVKMWRNARFPIPDNLGPGKQTITVKLRDTSYGDATVSVSFSVKKAYFDGTDCRHAKCKYEHTLAHVKVFAPPGTKVKLGSRESTVVKDDSASYPYSHSATFPVDGMKYFRAFEKGDKSAGDTKEPLELTLPTGQVLKTNAPVAWRGNYFRWLDKRLDKAKPGTGVRVPGESNRAPARPRAIQVYPGSRLLGGKNADRPSMIDEVAHYKKREAKRHCGTYVSKWGSRYKSYMEYNDWVVDVYDRRTGRKKLQKVLLAKREKCPKTVSDPGQGQTKVYLGTTSAPVDDVLAFLKKRLANKKR